jgi:23S rRNA (pseudouridine1915-N3)-methyltransferase
VRITILAVGRLKAGPERELYDRYAERVGAAGKAVGLSLSLREINESRAGTAALRVAQETALVAAAIPAAARLIVLDSTGKSLASTALAAALAQWRDDGAADLAIAIGGPDGLDRSIVSRGDLTLAFGAATWPHQLVRIMLAEQLYRAVTILAGHPYHRA